MNSERQMNFIAKGHFDLTANKTLGYYKVNQAALSVKGMDYITSGISVLHMPDPDHLSINYLNQQMYQLLGFPIGQVAATGLETSPDPIIRKYKADAFTGVHPDDLARVKKAFHGGTDHEGYSGVLLHP